MPSFDIDFCTYRSAPITLRPNWVGLRQAPLYRFHGTSEPWTIGQNVSAGCIGLTNDDVTDLYDHVPIATHIVVLATVTPTASTQ